MQNIFVAFCAVVGLFCCQTCRMLLVELRKRSSAVWPEKRESGSNSRNGNKSRRLGMNLLAVSLSWPLSSSCDCKLSSKNQMFCDASFNALIIRHKKCFKIYVVNLIRAKMVQFLAHARNDELLKSVKMCLEHSEMQTTYTSVGVSNFQCVFLDNHSVANLCHCLLPDSTRCSPKTRVHCVL